VANLSRLARDHAVARTPGQTSSPSFLATRQYDTVVALAELIVPRTDTAGATDAGVADFVDTVLNDAPPEDRDEFLSGLAWIDARSREGFGVDFVDARPGQQNALLTTIAEPGEEPATAVGEAFFQAMKQLTVTGYYTSEAGMREELGITGNVFFADDPGCLHPEHKS
jgi:hypothetical protein